MNQYLNQWSTLFDFFFSLLTQLSLTLGIYSKWHSKNIPSSFSQVISIDFHPFQKPYRMVSVSWAWYQACNPRCLGEREAKMTRSAVHGLQRGFESSLGNLVKHHVSMKEKMTVENRAQRLSACLTYPKPQFGVKKAGTQGGWCRINL